MDGCREMIADDFDAGLGINCGDFGCRCESCVAKLEAEINRLEMIACTEVYDRCKPLEAKNAKLVARVDKDGICYTCDQEDCICDLPR